MNLVKQAIEKAQQRGSYKCFKDVVESVASDGFKNLVEVNK